MRTRRGPIGATAADRDPGRDPIHILFDIMTRRFGVTPLRWCGSAAAGAVPGRHLRALSGPEASGWRRGVEAHAPGRVMAPFCRHRTIPGYPDAYRQCSTRSSPRLMRGAPPRRTAACTRRPLRHGSDRGSLHRDMIKTRPSSSTRPPVTSQMTQTTHSADSTRSGSG